VELIDKPGGVTEWIRAWSCKLKTSTCKKNALD
jgi:hypothetical protein